MSRAGANSSARGQSVAQAQHPEGREPSAAAPPHAATTAAYLHGLDSEAAARFERGKAKRRALFLQYAETEYIDALDSVSVVERMEALQKITAVFEPDPEATTDDTMLGLQEKAITATLELLVQEDMPRAQALGFRALLALYPAPPKVPAPPKKDPKEKPKSKFAAAPKRAPPGRRSGAKAAGDAKSTHPKILECVAPKLTGVLAAALQLTGKDAVWYVRVWALRVVARLAPWTLILSFPSKREEPNAETAVAGLAKLADDEANPLVRYALVETIFKMQVFDYLMPKQRASLMVTLTDRMMVDPALRIRILLMRGLGPLVNTDPYTSQGADKEVLQTILSMFHDANATVRCLAMETLTRIYADKKDDKGILNQIFDQMRDKKAESFMRRRLSAAKAILPLLGIRVPRELQLPSTSETGDREATQRDVTENAGRELTVLVLAALTTKSNKQVIHDTVKLLLDDEHYVRMAAATVLAHVVPDDAATVTLIVKLIEGMSVEEKKKQDARKEKEKEAQLARQRGVPRGGQGAGQGPPKSSDSSPETGRQWIVIMASVYALKLLVGPGAGRQQLISEMKRLFPHYDATVRQAVAQVMVGLGIDDWERTKTAQDVEQVALSFLSHDFWGARELALQVIGQLAEGTQRYRDAPEHDESILKRTHVSRGKLVESLSDESWPVRHEAVLAVTKVFALYKGTDLAVWMPLIRAAAPAQLHGLSTDAINHLVKQSAGEAFALALDSLRVLSEGDESLRGILGGMLTEALSISSPSPRPDGACQGEGLLRQAVSDNVGILLHSHRKQALAEEQVRSHVSHLKHGPGGDIFEKSLAKFQAAAADAAATDAAEAAAAITEPHEAEELVGSGMLLDVAADVAAVDVAAGLDSVRPCDTEASGKSEADAGDNWQREFVPSLSADTSTGNPSCDRAAQQAQGTLTEGLMGSPLDEAGGALASTQRLPREAAEASVLTGTDSTSASEAIAAVLTQNGHGAEACLARATLAGLPSLPPV